MIFQHFSHKNAEDFSVFFTIYEHGSHLFNSAVPFEQTDNTPLTEGPMWNLVKTGQAVSEENV